MTPRMPFGRLVMALAASVAGIVSLSSAYADTSAPNLGAPHSTGPQQPGETAPYRVFVPSAATDTQWLRTEVTDPDEPNIERNDIAAVRFAVSDSMVNISIVSASPDGFAFPVNSFGVPSAVALLLVSIGPPVQGDAGPETRTLNILVEGPQISILTASTSGELAGEYVVPWAGAGDVIRFGIPRWMLGDVETVDFYAGGYDINEEFEPGCEVESCTRPQVDYLPDDQEVGGVRSFPLR